ncbi:MAG: DUF2795 domain-containing protein [Solirubrobacterales bacterium]
MASVHTESPTRELAKSLEGIDFPANKQKLVEYARSHGAKQEIIDQLGGMPDEQYTSMADVFKGFGMKHE